MQPKLRVGLTWITVISFSIFWWGGEEKKQIPFLGGLLKCSRIKLKCHLDNQHHKRSMLIVQYETLILVRK